jgi:diguanylate cyclase (GGDEF)-like protein
MARRKSTRLKAVPLRPETQRDAASSLGFAATDLSPRGRAKLLELLVDVERMRSEADRLGARIRELEALADTDPLSGAPNRRAFMRELAKMIAFADRHGGPVSVIYVDLNGFKAVNDRYGHRAGDAAIAHVAALIGAKLRGTDSFGRLGGDEFAVALMRADKAQATAKAEDVRRRLRGSPAEFEGDRLTLDASVGVYEVAPGDTAEEAVEAADAAMYQGKKTASRRSPSPTR